MNTIKQLIYYMFLFQTVAIQTQKYSEITSLDPSVYLLYFIVLYCNFIYNAGKNYETDRKKL